MRNRSAREGEVLVLLAAVQVGCAVVVLIGVLPSID